MNLSFKVTLEQRKIENVVISLKWISSLPYARKAFAIDKIKAKILAFLKGIYPVSPAAARRHRRYAPHLAGGWRVTDVPGLSDKVAFVLSHRSYKNPMIQKILLSLESGSRGYYRKLDKEVGEYATVMFNPGDHRGERHTKGSADFAQVKRLHIPARKGGRYLTKTYAYARSLILQAKPEYFKKVQSSFARGEKS